MPDPWHIAEFADRREPVENAGRGGGRLKVDPFTIEVEDLVQPGLGLVPGLCACLGKVDADRDRSNLTLRAVMPELAQPERKIAGLHVFTFNEIEPTERWRQEMLARLR